MSRLPVKNQVRLSPARCLALTIAGISYRLFRSAVTVAILALAVTFLAHGLAHSLIEHETRFEAYQQLREVRELGEWSSRMAAPDPAGLIRERLAGEIEPYFSEYQRWSGADDATMTAMADRARIVRQWLAFLDRVPENKRVILLSGRDPVQVLGELAEEDRRGEFDRLLEDMSLPEPVGGMAAVGDFARADLPALREFVERIQSGHRDAIEKVQNVLDGRTPAAWLVESPDVAAATLVDAGYTADETLVERLGVAAQNARTLDRIKARLANPDLTAQLIRRLDVPRARINLDTIIAATDSRGDAQWLAEALAETGDDRPSAGALPDAEQILAAAESYRRQKRLQSAAGTDAVAARTGLFDLPMGTRWLMILSFMVCAVGVANAMFMSVTERFTEIATMKCLGALDGFLMQMFLFESALQGVAGAIIGIVFGLAVAILRNLIANGGLVLQAMPWLDLFIVAGLALLAGLLLAVIAAVGPAWMAARLAPMEAMRIE